MQIVPLPQGFGVRVEDFDVAHQGDDAQVAALQQAFRDHHLIVFRSTSSPLPPERQVAVTRWFGPVIEEDGAWTVLDNAEATGRLTMPFHSDITFLAHPLAGISLYPQELPAVDTSTTFVSAASAWRALPEALQIDLAGRKARHSFTSDGEIDLGLPAFAHWHPVRLPHAETGEPLLFVTEGHVDLIEGMDQDGSAALLEWLFAVLYAPERQYEHVWRAGDLLVWNNVAVQHARTRAADPAEGRRVVRRVQLGDLSFGEQVARLRRQGEPVG